MSEEPFAPYAAEKPPADRVLDLIQSLYSGAQDNSWQEASGLAEMVTNDPFHSVPPEQFRQWLSEYFA